tara:strand:+ start:298 stop:480 length:183 start_codon:yes stop_codon:yes gene_type:complete
VVVLVLVSKEQVVASSVVILKGIFSWEEVEKVLAVRLEDQQCHRRHQMRVVEGGEEASLV